MKPLVQFKITVNDLVLRRKFQRAVRKFSDLRPEMDQVGRWLVRDARKRLESRKSKVSIGRLAKSLTHKAYKKAVTITSVLPYARVQQQGGTILPRRVKHLAIPMKTDLARTHTWPKMLSTRTKSMMFVRPVRGGKLGLFKRLENGGVELWYLLVKRVRIPGRPYLVKSKALVRYMRGLVIRKYERAWDKEVG